LIIENPQSIFQSKQKLVIDNIMNFTIETYTISLKSKGNCDIINITNKVQEIIIENNFIEGSALIFVPGSTAGITTIEYEPGLLKDYPNFFEKIIPKDQNYHHDNTWHDGNGHSHVRASLQGASFTVPFKNKSLILGTWQQIIFVDFDNRPREREIIVQITSKRD
jgi:secondary thiamine-phosphate synthase enzyme